MALRPTPVPAVPAKQLRAASPNPDATPRSAGQSDPGANQRPAGFRERGNLEDWASHHSGDTNPRPAVDMFEPSPNPSDYSSDAGPVVNQREVDQYKRDVERHKTARECLTADGETVYLQKPLLTEQLLTAISTRRIGGAAQWQPVRGRARGRGRNGARPPGFEGQPSTSNRFASIQEWAEQAADERDDQLRPDEPQDKCSSKQSAHDDAPSIKASDDTPSIKAKDDSTA